MNTLPKTIKNPLIGDTVTFLKTAEETDGAYTLVEVELSPGGGNDMHYHVDFTETFEVLHGTLGIGMEKEVLHLKPGERAVAEQHVVHRFFNPDMEQPVKFLCTITPACSFEQMLRIAYGLANDGKTNKKGIPALLPLAIMFEKGGTYLPGVPFALQKTVFGFMAKVAKWRGVDKQLAQYYLPRP